MHLFLDSFPYRLLQKINSDVRTLDVRQQRAEPCERPGTGPCEPSLSSLSTGSVRPREGPGEPTKRGQLWSHQVVGLPASLSHPGRGMGPGLEGHSGLSNLSAYDGRFYNRCPRSPPCPSPYNTRRLPCLCPRKTTHWLSSFLVFDLALMDGRGAAAVGALAPC